MKGSVKTAIFGLLAGVGISAASAYLYFRHVEKKRQLAILAAKKNAATHGVKGKSGLVGGALWSQYSNKVRDRMNNPHYRGELNEEDCKKNGSRLVAVDWGSEACGDMVRMYWEVDPKTEVIKEARFKSFGCGTAIASSDVTAELCRGKTLDQALKITNLEVEKALRDYPDVPAIPPQKMHCSVMSYEVIKKAVSSYRGVSMDSLEDREIVCDCARVTMGTIKEAIRLNDLKTVEDITLYTKAGGYCKSCVRPGGHEPKKHYLIDILRETREEMAREKVGPVKLAANELSDLCTGQACENCPSFGACKGHQE